MLSNCSMFTWIIPYSNNAISLWLQTHHEVINTCTYESVWHSVGWTGRSRSLLENSLTLWPPSFPPASGVHQPPAAHFYPQGLDRQTHYDHKFIFTYYSFCWSVIHHVSKSLFEFYKFCQSQTCQINSIKHIVYHVWYKIINFDNFPCVWRSLLIKVNEFLAMISTSD